MGSTGIPDGYHALTPHIAVNDAARAIAFYAQAFGATEIFRLTEPGRSRIGHAELQIGDSRLMLSDEYPDFGAVGPTSLGGTPVALHLYVPDADAMVARAVGAGATLLRPVQDQFYGDRSGTIQDPFGHKWHIATATVAVTPQDMQRRWNQEMGGGQG